MYPSSPLPIARCLACTKNTSTLKFRNIELCLSCARSSIKYIGDEFEVELFVVKKMSEYDKNYMNRTEEDLLG